MSLKAAFIVIYLDFTGRLLAILATPARLVIAAIFVLAVLFSLYAIYSEISGTKESPTT